jgi:hypothetical protein
MDPEVLKLFGVMTAIMIPVGLGGGVFVLIASFAKRRRRGRIPESAAQSQQLSACLDALERTEAQIQQLEERLDFIERVLPALREGKPLPEKRSGQRETTPV